MVWSSSHTVMLSFSHLVALHCHLVTLSSCYTVILSHSLLVTQSSCHTVILLHSHLVILSLSHSHLVTLSYTHHVTQSSYNTRVKLFHSHIVTHTLSYVFLLQIFYDTVTHTNDITPSPHKTVSPAAAVSWQVGSGASVVTHFSQIFCHGRLEGGGWVAGRRGAWASLTRAVSNF